MAAPLAVGFIVSLLLALRVSYRPRRHRRRRALLAAPVLGLQPRQRLDRSSPRCSSPILAGAIATVWRPSSPDRPRCAAYLGAQDAAAVVSWTVAILVAYGALPSPRRLQAVLFRTPARLARRRNGLPTHVSGDHKRSRNIATSGRSAGGMGARELARRTQCRAASRAAAARPTTSAGIERHQQVELVVGVAGEGQRREAARPGVDAELLPQLADQRRLRASRRARACRRETPRGPPSPCLPAAARSAPGRRGSISAHGGRHEHQPQDAPAAVKNGSRALISM